MIRNIVFDMGMVLLEYDPVKVCWEYTDNPEDVEWMRRELFDSKEWSLLDEGTLTDAQALERVQKRLPNEHLRWLAKESLEHWHEYNIWAKPGMGELVKELKEKGLIDGIGMQSHLDVGFPNASTYRKAIDKFASTGLDIQVTELDITTSDTSEAGLEKQAQLYSDIFDIYTDYADSISAVVVWGVTDDQSWRATRVPLLFDENFQAKPAYYSIVDNVEPKVTTTTTTEITTDTTPSETTTTTETTFWLGDVNLDGRVNVQDVVLLQKYLIRKETLTAEQAKPADSNSDGVINVIDLSRLKKWILSVD